MKEIFNNIRGAIFDIDGTILDSMHIWDTAGNRYLETLGVKTSDELGKALFPLTLKESAEYLKKEFSLKQSVQEIMTGVNKVMEDFYKYESDVKTGMDELLKELFDDGVKITAATSTDRHLFIPALERLNLLQYFHNIYTCSEIGKSKSYPDIFLEAMNFMKTTAGETWLFEDGLYSAKTAKNIGINIVGIYDETSKHDWEELKEISNVTIMFEDEQEYEIGTYEDM